MTLMQVKISTKIWQICNLFDYTIQQNLIPNFIQNTFYIFKIIC